jgi:predicted permease
MSFVSWMRAVGGKMGRRDAVAEEITEELRAHIACRADDLERGGLPRAEAERRARIEFGGVEKFRAQSYEAQGGQLLETFAQDARYSLRVLRRKPGFAIAAVLTLALAIGANALVFGVMNALILHPQIAPRPASLYTIQRGADRAPNASYPDYVDLRDRNHSFETLMGYNLVSIGLDTGNNPTSPWGYEVTSNYFEGLGVHPYLGRFFQASDEHGPNSVPYLVIGYDYWRTHFAGERNVVGRVVQVNKHPFTILGVAPPDFRGTLLFVFPDFWAPMVDQEQIEGDSELNVRARRDKILLVMGHLKPGVTPAQAIADLNGIGAWLAKSYPKEDAATFYTLGRPWLAGDFLAKPVAGFIAGVMMLAGLILLAACANLGSLFAARAADRSREVALRLALGSSRSRILRQVFTEAVLISLVGGALGLAGSVVLLRDLSAWQPFASYPLHVTVNADATVYGMALLLALASGFLFGAVPVRQILRTDAYQVVKQGAAGAGRQGRKLTARDVLLTVQIMICAVLVTASLVAVRGLMRSMNSHFGFDPRNATVVSTDLNMSGYTGERLTTQQRRMVEAMQTLPGVQAAGLINIVPISGGGHSVQIFSAGTSDLRPGHEAAVPMQYSISPGYLAAAGTRLLAGRSFTWHDDAQAPRVAVINERFAQRVFGSVTGALGGSFKLLDGTRVQVVGVTEDGIYYQMSEDSLPAMFFPILQEPSSFTNIVVRSRRSESQVVAAVHGAMVKLDAGLPYDTQTWNQTLQLALFPSRIATVSLGVLGMMGAMLSITGIFGMAAYSVSRRLRELGIRIALGAQRREVLGAALGRAVKLLALGSCAGLVLGVLASRVLAYIVYEANPRDPLVLGGVVLAMGLVGLVATWIPAQRALGVDPMMLLREE